jgi:predicted N-acetyltransferase YhbS
MISIRQERPAEAAAREALLDRAYGSGRFTKPSQRLRANRAPANGLALVAALDGEIVGTVRLWNVTAGRGRPALLLGPLAVDPRHRSHGIGAALMRRALREARRLGHAAVLLIGDAAYYQRFGFSAEKTGLLRLSWPYDRNRLLAVELKPGALDGASGFIRASGTPLMAPTQAVAKAA